MNEFVFDGVEVPTSGTVLLLPELAGFCNGPYNHVTSHSLSLHEEVMLVCGVFNVSRPARSRLGERMKTRS